MAYRGKTVTFFAKSGSHTFYHLHLWQYEGKTKFLRKIFSGEKINFPLNFRFLASNGQGTSKNAYIFKFLVDPIFAP